MRRFISSVILFLFYTAGHAQALTLPAGGQFTVKEGKTATPYSITIPVAAIPASGKITVSDANGGTADEGKDYKLLAGEKGTRSISARSPFITVSFIVYSRNIQRENVFFEISFSYEVNGAPQVEKLKVIIQSLKPIDDSPDFPDTTKWSVRLITGANFDFFEAPAFKNFAGDFNVFLPDLVKYTTGKGEKVKTHRMGAEFGFFNYRYYEADSSNGSRYSERYLLNPSAQQITPGTTKYVNEQYALNARTTYNTIGMYLNPMIRLSASKCTDIYLNLHFEWLTRTQIQTYEKNSMFRDTLTYTTADENNRMVLQAYPGQRPAYQKKTFNDFYLGIGLPVRASVRGAFLVTFTPTIGAAAFERSYARSVVDKNNLSNLIITQSTEWHPYFLGKAQLITTQAPIDLALGMELRKVSSQPLFLAVYLGAVLSLDKFKR